MGRHAISSLGAFALASLGLLFAPRTAAAVINHSGAISANQTWAATDVHVLTGDVTVLPGVTLTIAPGTIVKGNIYCMLAVDGILSAAGDEAHPIIFTSVRDDVGGDTNGDGSGSTAAAGNWDRIRFSASSGASVLSWCTVRYGGTTSCCTNYNPMVDIVDCSPTFTQCTFAQSAEQAISVSGGSAAPTFTGGSVVSAGNYAIRMSVLSNPTFAGLTATGSGSNNGIQLDGGTITSAARWRNFGLSYIVTSDVSVGNGASLTVDPGVRVKFSTYTGLMIDGTLTATGTALAPIYFTSLRDDVGDDTNGDGSSTLPAGGNWERLKFSATSSASTLSYCVIRYGGVLSCCTNYVPMVDVIDASPTFEQCAFASSAIQAISVSGSSAAPTFSNSSIVSPGDYSAIVSVASNPTFTNVAASGTGTNSGIQLNGGTITGAAHWRNMGLPYIVTSDVSVGNGASLTIDPGVIIKFITYTGLYVDGTLAVNGTSGARVYFTSIRDDVGGDTNGDGSGTTPAAGNWERLKFSATSGASTLNYATIRYGGVVSCCTNYVPMIDVIDASPHFEQCVFASSGIEAFSSSGTAAPVISNSTVQSAGNYAFAQTVTANPTYTNVTATGTGTNNGIQIDGGTVTTSAQLRNMGLPYIFTNDLRVGSGATLTIDPGVILKFALYNGLFVDGTLVASGTSNSPIYFTSIRDDVGGDTNGDGSATLPAAGNWERIQFSATSSASVMEYATVRYGGVVSCCTNYTPMIDVVGSAPQFDNDKFTDAATTVISASSGALPVIHRSTILADTSVYGVRNTTTTVTVDASLNWWGSASGPHDTSAGPPLMNVLGMGAKVSDYVNYANWQVGAPVAQPLVAVSPTAISASGFATTPVQRTLTLQNTGNGSLTYSIAMATAPNGTEEDAVPQPSELETALVSWLTVSPLGGTLGPSGLATLTVTMNPTGLVGGQYSAFLIVNTNDVSRPAIVVPVTFSVNAPLPPSSIVVVDPLIGASLKVSWTASPSPGVARYRVYRAKSATGPWIMNEVSANQREYTDYNLEDNTDYWYAVSSAFSSGLEGERRELGAPRRSHDAVVLVHGLCDEASTFNTLRDRLRAAGFAVYAGLNFTPSNARPQQLVSQLSTYIASIPSPRVSIIAHSMGGLVSREYIVRSFESAASQQRVSRLITIGTPHHGSDAAAFLYQHTGIRRTMGLVECAFGAPALWDLIPGSAFLNGLNYGGGQAEPFASSTSNIHAPESLRDPTVTYRTFAGTGEFCDVSGLLALGIWRDGSGAHIPNDGLVSTYSAGLANLASLGWIDSQLGYGPLGHMNKFPSRCRVAELESSDLATNVVQVLNGQTPTPQEPLLPALAGANEQAVAEPTLADLPSPEGTIGAGATLERTVLVPGTTYLKVLGLSSNDSHLRLRTPGGITISPADTLIIPGLTFVRDELGNEGYQLSEPEPGTWTLVLDASSSTTSGEYATLVQVASSRTVKVTATPSTGQPSDTVQVRAWYANALTPTPGATLTGSLTRPDLSSQTIPLFDDGAHGDSGPNDGYFGARLVGLGTPGEYLVSVTGTPAASGASASRTGGTMFEKVPASDLSVVPGSLTVNKPFIMAGDTVTVFADIANNGTSTATNIGVSFSDGDPGVQFGATTVTIAPGTTTTVQAQWVASLPDTHIVRVVVDPFGLSSEANYVNNSGQRIIVLGQAVTGVRRDLGTGLWFSAPRPNPSSGPTVFRFSLPATDWANLEVFDVQGRRVHEWRWSALPPGVHDVTWEGADLAGDRVRGGIYFVRLSTARGELTHRFIKIP